MQRAQHLGGALAFAIDLTRVRRLGSAHVVFRNARQVCGLPPVDGAGAGEQEPPRAGAPRELQRAVRSSDNRVEHPQPVAFRERHARVGRRVDDVRERTIAEHERTHVAFMQRQRRMQREVRNLLLERLPISRQRHNRRVELQPVVRPQQGLEQPAAKEPRSSRDEEARTAKVVPQSAPAEAQPFPAADQKRDLVFSRRRPQSYRPL